MTRLYVSGPMTGLPESNFPRFNEVSAQLESVGYQIDNPAAKGEIDGWIWEDYLKFDLEQVIRADGIATIENWRKSRGARLEVRVAKALSIPVKSYKKWLADSVDAQAEAARLEAL